MLFIIIITIFVAVLYLYNTRTFGYWQKRGIKHAKPKLIFGTNADGYLMRRSTSQVAEDTYWRYPEERLVGCFRSTTPELLIRDPDLIKRVLLTDFSYFHNRTLIRIYEESNDPLMSHLFSVDGDLWRLLRQRLTPTFTSGKLKAMFPLIVERAERLFTRIDSLSDAPIDARDLMARFTTDFIGACAFGLDMDTLSDTNSKFRDLGVRIFKVTLWDAVRTFLKGVFPDAFKWMKWLRQDITDDVTTLVKIALEQRNYEPSGRNDFIDLLLECRKKGMMKGESIDNVKPDGSPEKVSIEMTDSLLAAQIFVFFAAGFETSSSTSSFTLHLLAYHPEKQRKVQEELDRVLARHGNKLSYDAIKEMSYLEWAFKESMRILPSVGFLMRTCTRKYTFPDMDLTIDKGVKVVISLQALHNDPKYFENPHEFRPERFDPKEFGSEKKKYVYLPFGEGPRACIGERLGMMQSMAGLAAVLSRFSVEPAPSSVRYPEIEAIPGVIQTIKEGLPLIFKARNKTRLSDQYCHQPHLFASAVIDGATGKIRSR